MVDCPRCKLISPPGATTCDCGYHLKLPAGNQPAAMRRPLERPPGRRQLGTLLLIATALVWGVYLLRWDSTNNLYGLMMLGLVPLSLLLIVAGSILFLSPPSR